jgi:TonB family protein
MNSRTVVPFSLLIVVAAFANQTKASDASLRGDTLYFENTEFGREAVNEIKTLYGGKQAAQITDQKLSDVQFPVPIFRVRPAYPLAMRRQMKQGSVTVDFIVDESGYVLLTAVIKSDDPGFNDAAIAAIKQWKFKPAKREGKNVRCRLYVHNRSRNTT